MNENNDIPPEMPDIVQQNSQQTVNQNSSALDKTADDELKTILTALEALPFIDENQKTTLFKTIHRLQAFHVIQVFNLGVAPLQRNVTEYSECLEEVTKLFEICFSFCYTTDVSKRVAFEYCIKALKFCFSWEPKQCLSTAVVSMLLQLVQILQEGKLASIVCDNTEQLTNSKIQINGTKHFTAEILAIFEKRRDDGCIAEIIAQTLRFASADASISHIEDHVVENLSLRSDHVVSPVFLANWVELLKLENVSNTFASAVAKIDPMCYKKQHVPLLYPGFGLPSVTLTSNLYQSTVCNFVRILEDMKRNGNEVILSPDEERLQVFFNHINHFCYDPKVTATSLKLLASKNISNDVLVEILDQFCCEEKRPSQNVKQSLEIDVSKAVAFELLFNVLSLFTDGELVNKVLKFWKENIPGDPNYHNLSCLLGLLVEESSSEDHRCLQERAERTFNFLNWLPPSLMPLLPFWHSFLACFKKIFPTSFQRHPEVLVFIHKALQAARVPAESREVYIMEQLPTLQFLEWVSQQSFTEEMKNEMICLLMCCTDGRWLGDIWEFSIRVVKQLSACKQLQFCTKQVVIRQLTCFAKLFKGQEKKVFLECVENVAANESLELKNEIFTEILHFVERFADRQRPMKTIPSDVLQLFSLVSKVPISGDRRVKVLQMAMESRQGLDNGIHILQLIEINRHILDEGTNEYFDHLVSAFVDVLKGKKDLCRQFYDQQLQRYCSSVQVQEVWSIEVAKLIFLGSFNEEIDCWCCFPLLNDASGVMSSTEMLQLFFQVRTSAEAIVHLLRDRKDIPSSPDASDRVPSVFVSSLAIIVRSTVLSGEEKLLLVKKVCDIFLNCPEILTEWTMEEALANVIPSAHLQNSIASSNEEVMCLELNQIVAMLENPTSRAQLARIPFCMGKRSLCTVLSSINSDLPSREKLADTYHFIVAQEDLEQAFFDNVLPFLEIVNQESNSVDDVLEILKELVCILRAAPSELTPFVILNFEHLFENKVNKHERKRFFNDVTMKWNFAANACVLSYLEVPRLLWKAYTASTDTPAEQCELIGRLQQILKKMNENTEIYCVMGHHQVLNVNPPDDIIVRRKIACSELEWLVFHSSLTIDEAALACNLSFRSCNQLLRCFSSSDIQIEDGVITCLLRKTSSGQEAEGDSNRCDVLTSDAAERSIANVFPRSKPHTTILTPVSIAQKVIHHVARVLRKGEDPTEKAFSLWDLAFGPTSFRCGEAECAESLSFLDDYVEVFLSILAAASSTDVMLHWIRLDRHHLCQCAEVVLEACKWSGDVGDIVKEDQLKLQAAVSTTMETMRVKTPRTHAFSPFIRLSVPCFRLLKPQLKHLSNMLQSRLPIEVTTAVLGLFQDNVQAAVTVGEIISSWPCKERAVELAESMQLHCRQEEITALSPEQSEFVWQLLKAFGRFCVNSCEDLLARFKELIELHGPDDVYGFNRLPKWRQEMLADGFPTHVIDSWCVAFLSTTPLEDLSSRDVDAIVDLNARSLQLVTTVSQRVKSCIFPVDGFEEMQGVGVKSHPIKERLRLARLLGEFINILKLRKPEENPKDAVIRDIVVEACDELCGAHEKQSRNELYKIHDQKLKALFAEVFGKQRKPNHEVDCTAMTEQSSDEEARGVSSVARQSSYLHENLPRILRHNEVYESLLILLRRWLSGIVRKPTLASHTLEIVQRLFSEHSSDVGPGMLKELHDIIQERILSLPRNQAFIAQLQAAGYNQREQGTTTRDLWSSPILECPGYLSKREPPDSKIVKKKLTKVLRRLWSEWKNILFMLGIASIKVGEIDMSTKDLFGVQATLEEMEEQVSVVKKIVNQIKSEDVDRPVKQLMRLEQRHRARIERLYKSDQVRNGLI